MNIGGSICVPNFAPEQCQLFFDSAISVSNWSESREEEVVLDIGCGAGYLTKSLVLPVFPELNKIYAIDKLAFAVRQAEIRNSHPKIEYSVADIEKWSAVAHLEGNITKAVSVQCLQWLNYPVPALINIFKLLKTGGEAVIVLTKTSTFYDTLMGIQEEPEWIQYFQNIGNCAADSPLENRTSCYYKSMLEDVGFEILHCIEKGHRDTFPSMEDYKAVFTSLCVLLPYIPDARKEIFKNDFIELLLDKNGEDDLGKPFHSSRVFYYILKKK